MSTSPLSPPDSDERHAPDWQRRKTIHLAELATIFAVVFGIAFGLCSVGALVVMMVSEGVASALIGISIITEGICALGLVIIGVMAFIRYLRKE